MTLFNIQLKVEGNIINVPVYKDDTHQTLVERFCTNNMIRKDYQSAVKDKIIQQLLSIINSKSIKSNLKEKVSKFIGQHVEKPNSHSFNDSKTPYKILQQDSYAKSNQSPPNRHRNLICLQNKKNKKSAKQKIIKVNTMIPNNSPKKVQPDLIMAYQTIINKSKDPSMKEMAKKYLQNAKIVLKSNQHHIYSSEFNSESNNQQLFQSQDRDFPTIKSQQKNHYKNKNLIKYNYQRTSVPDNLILSKLYDEDRSRQKRNYLGNHLMTINEYSDYAQLPHHNRSNSNLRKTKRYKYIID